MKLCVTGLRGIPDVMGGIETHAQFLYPELARLDPSLEIVVFARRPYVRTASYRWREVRIVPAWAIRDKYLETALHTLWTVCLARFVERADVVHIHGIGPALFAPVARMLGMPVVVTHHGHDYERLKWGPIARRALRLGEFLMMATADRVIAVGRSSAERLKERYPSRAHVVEHIPNGVSPLPTEAGSGEVLAELGLTAGSYALAVGRLVPEKGFQDLIAAVAATPAMRLVIVGASDHEDAFCRQLKEQAAACDRVVLAGRRRRADLAGLYRHAALFVLPSYHEGHPIAALEAMEAGLPVLLSDITPNRDIGLPDRHYVPPGDRVALAARLSEPVFDDLRPEAEAVLSTFRWDRIARLTHAALTDLLRSRSGQAARGRAERSLKPQTRSQDGR